MFRGVTFFDSYTREISSTWWLFLLEGLCLIGFGIPGCTHADHPRRPGISRVHRAGGDDVGDGVSGSSSAPAVRDSETRMVE